MQLPVTFLEKNLDKQNLKFIKEGIVSKVPMCQPNKINEK